MLSASFWLIEWSASTRRSLFSTTNAVARVSACCNLSLTVTNSNCTSCADANFSIISFNCLSCAAEVDLSSCISANSLALPFVSTVSCCLMSAHSLCMLPILSSAVAFMLLSAVSKADTSSLESAIMRCDDAFTLSVFSILSCSVPSFSFNASYRTDSTRILLLKSASSATRERISASLSSRIPE